MEIRGADDLARLARDLRAAGGRRLIGKVHRALQAAAKPVEPHYRRELEEHLPAGYAPDVLAALKVRTSTRLTGAEAGVTVVGTSKGRQQRRDLPALNRGELRHPLHGNRKFWYVTTVDSGTWDRAADAGAEAAKQKVGEVLRDLAREIGKG